MAVALLANLGVAVAKLAAAMATGSTALSAETAHAGICAVRELLVTIIGPRRLWVVVRVDVVPVGSG